MQSLADDIISGPAIEGVTFLGGEPFAQAAALAELGFLLKERALSIVTFTGYLIEDLQATAHPDYGALLAVTDLLIDGPFEQGNLDFNRPWVGSRNQRYHYLTDRYRSVATEIESIPNRWEIRIGPNGNLWANGLGDVEVIERLVKGASTPE